MCVCVTELLTKRKPIQTRSLVHLAHNKKLFFFCCLKKWPRSLLALKCRVTWICNYLLDYLVFIFEVYFEIQYFCIKEVFFSIAYYQFHLSFFEYSKYWVSPLSLFISLLIFLKLASPKKSKAIIQELKSMVFW